jgi:hypothetical protein
LGPLRAMLNALPSDSNLDPLLAFILLLERMPTELLAVVGRHRGGDFSGQMLFVPDAYAAWAYRMRGDESAARTAFTSALVALGAISDAGHRGWLVHAERGLALAALGRRAEALPEVQWLEHTEVFRNDAFEGASVANSCALILAQLGEVDAALDRIERLLSVPSELSVHSLRLDPRWDPIRDHPRFKALLAKYAKG